MPSSRPSGGHGLERPDAHLLLHANRNGFFYVLDRTNGKLLLAKPFVKKLTWAREIDADGRPVRNPDQEPTTGNKVCPSLEGATNWFSTAFLPSTGLYYVQTLEKCGVYTKAPAPWKAGAGISAARLRAPRMSSAENSARHQHRDRRHRLGTAANRPRHFVGRHARHRAAAWSSSAKTAER